MCIRDRCRYAAHTSRQRQQPVRRTQHRERAEMCIRDSTETFTATVTVSNTGDRDGKATVELYAQTPYTDYDKQNNVEKSSIQLLGYDKIDVAAVRCV